jgi:acyl-[acyl-carrier-protein]-phospholipid O-acyltransferase/long-chain-fatty-acid--[acyl-carrier-protein] ligase
MDIVHLKYGLFLNRRFLPMFLAQFLGAFNDNLLRNGLVVMIAFAAEKGIHLPYDKPAVLVTICSALLVFPFILFSSLAGQLADKYPKAKLITYTKIAEILIMCTAFYGFHTNNIGLLMVLLFISGTHSTFFGPIKYSILPELLKDGELLAGNGFISGGTYLAVLGGLIAGAILIELPHNIIGITAIGIALAGFIATLFIPRSPASAPQTEVHYNLWTSTKEMVSFARSSKTLFSAILGISWFLLVGSVFMTQFANYSKEVVHGDNEVYTMLLTLFSIGIASGAVLADQILKGEITGKLAPWALLGVSVFTLSMVVFTPHNTQTELITASAFIQDAKHWPMLISIVMVALSGGIYMVPLYAMLQKYSEAHFRSRVIAASNMFDSLFMTAAAIISVILLHFSFSITDLFSLLAAANLLVFLYARKLTAPTSISS